MSKPGRTFRVENSAVSADHVRRAGRPERRAELPGTLARAPRYEPTDGVRPSALASGPAAASKAAMIYTTLKQRLIRGQYQLGEPLLVVRLTAEFHTSRQPVMEALRWLAAEEFVEIMPQIGCRAVLSPLGDISDFFLIFAVQEGLATALAADRRTDEDIPCVSRS